MIRKGFYIRMGYFDGLPRCMKVGNVEFENSVTLEHSPINGFDSWTYPGCTTGLSYTFGWKYAHNKISSGEWEMISSNAFRELRMLYENRASDSAERSAAYYTSLCKACDTPYFLQVI